MVCVSVGLLNSLLNKFTLQIERPHILGVSGIGVKIKSILKCLLMCNENPLKSCLVYRGCPKKREEEERSSPEFNLVHSSLKDGQGYCTMNIFSLEQTYLHQV